MDTKTRPLYMLSTRDPSQNKGHRLKAKGLKKIFHANRDQKKAGVAILISDKIDFKTKAVKRDKEGHYIMIKGSIQEEDITIINIYAPNIGAPQYVRQMLLLLLSHFSHVRPLATPWTAAYEALPSMGFSRQEYWSGLPLLTSMKGEINNNNNSGSL